MELSNKNYVHLKDLEFLSKFQKEIQRRLESQKKKRKEMRRILYYIQNSKREFKFSKSWKRREKKKEAEKK